METTEKINKNDFIEIEFTGKANNEIFDTTNKKEAESIGLNADVKPVIVSAGNQMLLKGFDEALEGKDTGKKYFVHLTPEQAFGKRDPKLINLIPMRVFREKNINPVPGMTFQLDNSIVKILSVSGGRVTVDFNNPLAGKDIDYDFIIKRKITDDSEKINALQDYFFKNKFEFEIKQDEKTKTKKVIFKDEKIKPLIELMKQKFKDMTGFDFEVKENKEIREKEVKDKFQENKKEIKEKTGKKDTNINKNSN